MAHTTSVDLVSNYKAVVCTQTGLVAKPLLKSSCLYSDEGCIDSSGREDSPALITMIRIAFIFFPFSLKVVCVSWIGQGLVL